MSSQAIRVHVWFGHVEAELRHVWVGRGALECQALFAARGDYYDDQEPR